jgi:hypothetical protein
MPRSDNTGKCELCGHTEEKSAMPRHLAECLAAHDPKGKPVRLVQLRFEVPGDPRYWLYVEARAESTLQQLDSLLRSVWLECCGHMSAFYVGQAEPNRSSKVGAVLASKGLKFRYEYDFGSTTLLNGHVVGTREGPAGRPAARVLARNDPPTWSCSECAAAATTVCPFCLDEGGGLLCEEHATTHPHAEEEVYLPVVNSPRMGVCGYTG